MIKIKPVNPHMIIAARESLGLSQGELAEKMGVTQGKVSKIENGFLGVSPSEVEKLIHILGYPSGLFFETENIYPSHFHYYRKASSVSAKVLAQVNAIINIDRIRVQKLLRSIEFQHSRKVEFFDLDEYGTPVAVAQALRRAWRVPRGPISNIAELVEDAGIVLFPIDFGTRLLSDVTVTTEDGVYIIFLNHNMPGDRERFTIAHALGHIAMQHLATDKKIEEQADQFAGEFLMPRDDVQHQLSNISLAKLADLKKYWKVSMSALLMRSKHLGKIDENKERYLWARMSKLGFRLNEPVELAIPQEIPWVLHETVTVHMKELGYSKSEMQEMLYLRNEDFPKYGFQHQPIPLKLIKSKS